MPRIVPLDPATAQGKAADLLGGVQKALGAIPNLFRVVAQSPAALDGLLALNGALARGSFNAKARESIALAVAQENTCDYCLSAHSFLGQKAGLSAEEIAAARLGVPGRNDKTAAAIALARSVVTAQGRISDGDLASARVAGLSDGDIVEVVAHVAVNIFTNYINHVAETAIDFPVVPSAPRVAA